MKIQFHRIDTNVVIGLLVREFCCSGTDVSAKVLAMYAGTRTPSMEPQWLAAGLSQKGKARQYMFSLHIYTKYLHNNDEYVNYASVYRGLSDNDYDLKILNKSEDAKSYDLSVDIKKAKVIGAPEEFKSFQVWANYTFDESNPVVEKMKEFTN